MKKRAISILMIIVAVCSTFSMASAVDVVPYASAYLDGYSVALQAEGNGEMSVSMTVDGVGVMDKIGVREIYIEEKYNGVWNFYDSLDAAEHPEFYDYNSRDYIGTTYFTGRPGRSYRVTLTVYAKKGSGSDTGDITSYTVTCK